MINLIVLKHNLRMFANIVVNDNIFVSCSICEREKKEVMCEFNKSTMDGDNDSIDKYKQQQNIPLQSDTSSCSMVFGHL